VLILAVLLIAVSAIFAVLALGEFAPGRSAALARRMAELEEGGGGTPEAVRRRRRQARSERLTALIQALGEQAEVGRKDISAIRLRLVQAGYPNANAVALYLGTRLGLPIALSAAAFILTPALDSRLVVVLGMSAWAGVLGYIFPAFYTGSRIKSRQKQMQKALPDALDLLVVSVEAGLGLNQALVRVSEEIERVSTVLSEQIGLVNLEIRAGTPRDEALRNLADRTGLEDVRSLVAMLIQTDRFGTSIAQALRVQSETLRSKRRQRAEEAAAKTTIKLVFPLVLFIFPAMFVVILGPALIQIFEVLANFGR
jgi:tight adherence protein C